MLSSAGAQSELQYGLARRQRDCPERLTDPAGAPDVTRSTTQPEPIARAEAFARHTR
jgi:hypothetical protein